MPARKSSGQQPMCEEFTQSDVGDGRQAPSLQPVIFESQISNMAEKSQHDMDLSKESPPKIDETSIGMLDPASAHSAPRVNRRRPIRRRWSQPASASSSNRGDKYCVRNNICPTAPVRLAQQRAHRDGEEREPATTSRVPKRRHVVRCRRCAASEVARHKQPVLQGAYVPEGARS